MHVRILVALFALGVALQTAAQTLTVAGGQTIRAATKHDSARVEGNFSWMPDLWRNDNLSLSLNQAVGVAGFWDLNDVYMISWAPNFILTPADRSGIYPYFQFGVGLALFSDDKFESRDDNPYDDGASDMGSEGQFENSVALGLVRDPFSMRIKLYHYSNLGLADPNGGMDVLELGFSYRFQ